jgi:hypothetical protein
VLFLCLQFDLEVFSALDFRQEKNPNQTPDQGLRYHSAAWQKIQTGTISIGLLKIHTILKHACLISLHESCLRVFAWSVGNTMPE